jgi:hypothetical protein
MTMKRLIACALRRLGWLRYDLLVSPVSLHPGKNAVPPGELWVVTDAGVKKWACMSCPGGCGVQISLSLNPDRRPCWSVETDFWNRPTVTPSIRQLSACTCHFWISRGVVEWCR